MAPVSGSVQFKVIAEGLVREASECVEQGDHANAAYFYFQVAEHYETYAEVFEDERQLQKAAVVYAKAASMYAAARKQRSIFLAKHAGPLTDSDEELRATLIRRVTNKLKKEREMHREAARCFFGAAVRAMGQGELAQAQVLMESALRHYETIIIRAIRRGNHGTAARYFSSMASVYKMMGNKQGQEFAIKAAASSQAAKARNQAAPGHFKGAGQSFSQAVHVYMAANDHENVHHARKAVTRQRRTQAEMQQREAQEEMEHHKAYSLMRQRVARAARAASQEIEV